MGTHPNPQTETLAWLGELESSEPEAAYIRLYRAQRRRRRLVRAIRRTPFVLFVAGTLLAYALIAVLTWGWGR